MVVAFVGPAGGNLLAWLFGDILAVTTGDLAWIYGIGAVALAVLVATWRPLLAITVHADLAAVEGAPVRRVNLVFMLVMALVVAAAMKVAGILLVAALLVIPAAAARQFARTPEQMAVHMIGYIQRAKQRGARVVVFPEMAVVGYWPETINCSRCSERLPRVESTLAAAAKANDVYIIFVRSFNPLPSANHRHV